MIAVCFFVFGYLINMFYITVLYHRGLAHQSVTLGPRMLRWLYLTGPWMTGIDPKAWAAMHRVHHEYSDEKEDPHSPANLGIMGVWIGQYHSYRYYLERMKLQDDPKLNALMKDVPFGTSFVARNYLSNVPYLTHILIGVTLILTLGSFWIGFAYFAGMMSHPLQGWLVNALAHRYGHRNFETNDCSTNNLWVGYFVFGEGYQNNHHAFPRSAKFSMKFPELDLGYGMCLVAQGLGLLKIPKAR